MSKKTAYDKLVDWFDVKFGFAKTPLKPIPDFALNPIYWLGLLLAVTFGLQALTGICPYTRSSVLVDSVSN